MIWWWTWLKSLMWVFKIMLRDNVIWCMKIICVMGSFFENIRTNGLITIYTELIRWVLFFSNSFPSNRVLDYLSCKDQNTPSVWLFVRLMGELEYFNNTLYTDSSRTPSHIVQALLVHQVAFYTKSQLIPPFFVHRLVSYTDSPRMHIRLIHRCTLFCMCYGVEDV